MIIFVINFGSSSIKYQLYKMPSRKVLAHGIVEKIGEESSRHSYISDTKHIIEKRIGDHRTGIKLIFDSLTDRKLGVINKIADIRAIGHRVVHGGETYSDSTLIDENVITCIKDFCDLAPLHNPSNLVGIQECRAILPRAPMIAVFDTAFHQTIPPEAFTYALPHEFYTKYRIRRYGFHGTSHAYVTSRASKLLKIPLQELNAITCHLGNGCSICAIRNGKSIDTTMGFTPLEGLVMGTRCGDIYPAIIFYLPGKRDFQNYQTLDRILNKESGLLDLSGISNDIRNLEKIVAEKQSTPRPELALKVFCYRIKKYLGAYMAVLGKIHALVFTGGIGENSFLVRECSCGGLDNYGITINPEKNRKTINGKEGDIATEKSPVPILVIPTNEEEWIAKETYRLCKSQL